MAYSLGTFFVYFIGPTASATFFTYSVQILHTFRQYTQNDIFSSKKENFGWDI